MLRLRLGLKTANCCWPEQVMLTREFLLLFGFVLLVINLKSSSTQEIQDVHAKGMCSKEASSGCTDGIKDGHIVTSGNGDGGGTYFGVL